MSIHAGRTVRLIATLAVIAAAAPAAAQPALAAPGGASVTGLEVDGRADEPLGIDDRSPQLSWRVTRARDGWAQAAYQVRAARSESGLRAGRHLWDSGRVESAQQNDVSYDGPPLTSRQRVSWQVRVWDTSGRASAWSRPSSWEMGLLATERLGAGEVDRAPRSRDERPLADLRPGVHGRRAPAREGDPRPALCLRPRDRRREPQRALRHRRGARARELQLPAVGGVPHVRRDAPAARRPQHARRRARPQHRVRQPRGHQPRGRSHESLRVVAERRQGQRNARRTRGRRRRQRQAGQRHRLPRRRHDQRRHRRRRRPARVPQDHGDRQRGRRRHRDHVRAAAERGARRRRRRDRIREPAREHRPQRRRGRDAAADRPARGHPRRRLGRRDRQRPLVEDGPRADGDRQLVLGQRLRLAPRAGRLDHVARRSVGCGDPPRRLGRRLDRRGHRSAAQPHDRAGLARSGARRGGGLAQAGQHQATAARDVGVRPRPEHRRLA